MNPTHKDAQQERAILDHLNKGIGKDYFQVLLCLDCHYPQTKNQTLIEFRSVLTDWSNVNGYMFGEVPYKEVIDFTDMDGATYRVDNRRKNKVEYNFVKKEYAWGLSYIKKEKANPFRKLYSAFLKFLNPNRK